MREQAKPESVLSDKGTDKLLAAVDAKRYDTRTDAFEALKTLPGVYAIEISHRERTRFNYKGHESTFTWMVSAIHSDNRANAHVEYGMSLHSCVCRVLESYRLNPLGRDDAWEEINGVAERAFGMPPAKVTTGPTNDATTDTLPLVSNGPSGIGGEYQSEVRP